MSLEKKSVPYMTLIALSVVLFWRGIWGLADLYLFPMDAPLSYISSVLLGFSILMLTRNTYRL